MFDDKKEGSNANGALPLFLVYSDSDKHGKVILSKADPVWDLVPESRLSV